VPPGRTHLPRAQVLGRDGVRCAAGAGVAKLEGVGLPEEAIFWGKSFSWGSWPFLGGKPPAEHERTVAGSRAITTEQEQHCSGLDEGAVGWAILSCQPS
jgi:hypothetical protein